MLEGSEIEFIKAANSLTIRAKGLPTIIICVIGLVLLALGKSYFGL